MRALAIGDIHGCLGPLDDLLAWVTPTADDALITLGDYVDRGPDTRGVLNRLIELKKKRPLICLRGNHEIMMLDAWRGLGVAGDPGLCRGIQSAGGEQIGGAPSCSG